MNPHKRKLIILLLVLTVTMTVAVTVYFAWDHRQHSSKVFTTQRPGEQKIVWHTMGMKWERGIFQKGDALQISDIKSDQSSLYITAQHIISKIDKLSGSVVWKENMERHGESLDGDWQWSTTLASAYLIAAHTENSSDTSDPHDSRLCCIRALDGRLAWEVVLDTAISSEPGVAGSRLLVPLTSGEIVCISLSSGSQLWRRQVSTTHYLTDQQRQYAPLTLSADERVCVARAGGQHFMAVDPSTGETIWSRVISGSVRYAERTDKGIVPFTLDNGALYLAASNAKVAAWDASTGRRLWRRMFHLSRGVDASSASEPPAVAHDLLLIECGDSWAAVHRANGSIAWTRLQSVVRVGPYYVQRFFLNESNPTCDTLYTLDSSDPVVRGSQRHCRSVTASNIVAFDLATGKEKWRMQDDVTDYLRDLVPYGNMLYCNASDRVVALEPGPGESLPHFSDGRSQLAYRMIEDLTQWNPTVESPFARLRRRFPIFSRPTRNQPGPSRVHAQLCLLNLQSDSIAPLLELIKHQIGEIESPKQQLVLIGSSQAGELDEPLDLLYDIRAYSTVPALIKILQSARLQEVRQKIAELLIRLNRNNVMPPLYAYVKGCTDRESVGGEETLNYLCGFAPAGPSADDLSVTQKCITDYLAASITDIRAPAWLHRFAQFELLRGRGDAMRNLVLSHTQNDPRSRLMPTITEVMRPYRFSPSGYRGATTLAPEATTRDQAGDWWGVYECNYFGQFDVWIVHSKDGKTWTRPTVCVSNQDARNELKVKLQRDKSTGRPGLRLSWKDVENHRFTRLVFPGDLYRDSDRDGIPDIVERELGTNPTVSDSHGSGLSDGDNKNPMYRPHQLSQDEQIYQAVIEAACRFSHSWLPTGPTVPYWAASGPVDPDTPLFLPAGPAGLAVPIYSHAHSVLMYTAAEFKQLHRSSWGDIGFAKPCVGFDGKVDARNPYDDSDVHNSYPEGKPLLRKDWFTKWFPYLESSDKTRVRIGVYGQSARFDIEVDKIGGKWLPVECRRMIQYLHHQQWEAAAPVREQPRQ